MKYYLSIFLLVVLYSCSKNKSPFTSEASHCESYTSKIKLGLTKELDSIDNLLKTETGVCVLETGTSSLLNRAWLCEQAEERIDIQYFIFSADNIGLIACDYLVKAADRGVIVNILVDDILVDAEVSDLATLNKHENINIKVYNPGVNLGKNIFQKLTKFATDYRDANQRMHNKAFIVDGKTAITGGRNMADEYFDYDHVYNFRDRDVLILGKDVTQLSKSFDTFWNYDQSVDVDELIDIDQTDHTPDFEPLHQYACNPENFWPEVRAQLDTFHLFDNKITWIDNLQYISDIPGKNDGTHSLSGGGITTDSLIALVKKAKHRICIQTPYLVTTEESRALFKDIVSQGIEVQILTNSLASTDALEAFGAYQTDRQKVLETGIEVYEYKPHAAVQKTLMTGALHKDKEKQPIFGLHAKSLVIDDHIVAIGTFNLDPRSTHLNTECYTVFKSKTVAQEVLKTMERDLLPENSWRITPEFNPDHTVDRTKRIKVWTRKIVPKNIL